jgi:hypothetical protein
MISSIEINQEHKMSYFIVDTEKGKEHLLANYSWSGAHVYETERGAKIACSKLNKKTAGAPWTVMECSDWQALKALKFPVKMVKKVNMMSGKEYWEAEGTPGFLSPSSEAYWSM